MPTPEPEIAPHVTPTPERNATPERAEVRVEPPTLPTLHAPRTPRNAPTEPVSSIGLALALLCYQRGLVPVFDTDAVAASSIDVAGTITLLANDALTEAPA